MKWRESMVRFWSGLDFPPLQMFICPWRGGVILFYFDICLIFLTKPALSYFFFSFEGSEFLCKPIPLNSSHFKVSFISCKMNIKTTRRYIAFQHPRKCYSRFFYFKPLGANERPLNEWIYISWQNCNYFKFIGHM